MSRRGAVLIIVTGVAALLAALAFAFLERMRADGEEMDVAMRTAQDRIMLLAACSYLQEASRIGWNDRDPAGADAGKHKEAYGWLDVRGKRRPDAPDGELIGPRTDDWDGDGVYDPCFSDAPVERDADGRLRPAWPAIGGVARAPMHVLRRPPFASAATACYNPIAQDPADPAFGWPYLRQPDPQPAVDPAWPRAVDAARWADYRDGDPRPRPETTGLAWFRIRRDSAATFTITVGAGGTLGWRGWEEIPVAERAAFGGDRALFDDLLGHEVRAWYRVEWSGAVTAMDYHYLQHHATQYDHYLVWAHNASHSFDMRTQMHARNPVGTISWVQRLRDPPTYW